ncbi:MAG: multidrug ABC transporter ATP-binding protein, partial [Burkholderiales bacterium]|nr:multidrug ABC transporter ATP-binding protein [Burkholderiales bacterium]
LFLDEPTAGVDVTLRRELWALVRALRDTGVTVILTTHYIEEAEQMADRVGVIDGGRLVLVEDKAVLMRKLGGKQLTLALQVPLAALPPALAGLPLALAEGGHALVYTYEAAATAPGSGQRSGIAELLLRLGEAGVGFKDLQTSQSSLEDIFVGLVADPPAAGAAAPTAPSAA